MVASAEAELAPLGPGSRRRAAATTARSRYRQGKPMRPDVAQAFDRMERAARADGVALLITSAYPVRRRAGRAVAPPPGPAAGSRRPGESLHRYATELDLGPPAAYALAGGARAGASTSSSATRGSPGISATR